ncbi:MAG TPA: 1,4-dihydroxy-2-naphthoate polyprenyltransferase [Anaerolineales bacterium]|nr:1,4-dihydroxy-2-naphthoate polyprenyltransferase [Anaerolineales bacterium]
MNSSEWKINWNAWMLAIRPRTLPAAAAGVVMGCALAWRDGFFRLDASLACLLAALLLQIGSNLANDVFDFERGTDTPERLGPTRVTQAGLLTPREVKWGMAVVFGSAALIGLYLAYLGGLPIIMIGIAAIISAIAYTGGPFPLGYYGLGDIFVFIFFGLASVAGTYYVQAGFVSPTAWWMTIPPGLIITAILVVNNLRDLENDRKANKRTLAVKFGERATKIQYVLCLVIAYLTLPITTWLGITPWTSLLAWLSIPFAIQATRTVLTQKGRPLNSALASTGQAALFFSLLFWLGMLFQK